MKMMLTKIISGAAMLAALSLGNFAQADGPPEFVFNDRCVPHQLTDAAMLANGIDPTRILGGAGPGGGGGPPPTGPGGGNIQSCKKSRCCGTYGHTTGSFTWHLNDGSTPSFCIGFDRSG